MSDTIWAHGVGIVYESPIPLSYYLAGAGATVALSFVIRALARTTRPLRPERVVAEGTLVRWAVTIIRILAAVLLLLTLASGLVVRDIGFSLTTLGFWIGLIVLTTMASALVGGLWEQVDPWATAERFYRLEESDARNRTVPWWVGPALLFALFWFEFMSGAGFDAFWVVVALIAYSLFSFTLRAPLGESWKTTDPLSILFGFAARVAPFRLTEQRLIFKGPLRDLDRIDQIPMALYGSVFVMLASTTLDNASETVGWSRMLDSLGLSGAPDEIVLPVGLVAIAFAFWGSFVGALKLSGIAGAPERSLTGIARSFGWSLIPIGVAYVVAHNTPLLITGFPQLLNALADPFDLGWNLLGMGDLFHSYVPSPRLVWFLEIVIVVGGHVIGVLAAHRTAVNITTDHSQAVRSQYALTGLMSAYTIVTLWLLAQPLVA